MYMDHFIIYLDNISIVRFVLRRLHCQTLWTNRLQIIFLSILYFNFIYNKYLSSTFIRASVLSRLYRPQQMQWAKPQHASKAAFVQMWLFIQQATHSSLLSCLRPLFILSLLCLPHLFYLEPMFIPRLGEGKRNLMSTLQFLYTGLYLITHTITPTKIIAKFNLMLLTTTQRFRTE